MPLKVQCKSCFDVVLVRDELAGKIVRCKSCGGKIRIRRESQSAVAPCQAAKDDSDDGNLQEVIVGGTLRSGRIRKQKKGLLGAGNLVSIVFSTVWGFAGLNFLVGMLAVPLVPNRINVRIGEIPGSVIVGGAFLLVGAVWYTISSGADEATTPGYRRNIGRVFIDRLAVGVIGGLVIVIVEIEIQAVRILAAIAISGLVGWQCYANWNARQWRPLVVAMTGFVLLIPTFLTLFREN